MITVTVCTWNRAPLLERCLQQMTRLRPPAGLEWELLVVDNNSSDRTGEVIAGFAGRLPIAAIHEARPGLSHARNAAVARARGDYLVWTDDDIVVDAGWLAAYVEAFRRWPDAAVFGGPILPRFDGTPPRWLVESWPLVKVAYAARDFGPSAVALRKEDPGLPFGANFALRAREQRRFLYDPGLGRNQDGRLLLCGEETQVIESILAGGGTGWWVPDARVEHWIPAHRQTTAYLRLYFESRGRLNALGNGPTTVVSLLGRPRWAWRQAVVQELRYRLLRNRSPAPDWVAAMVRASEAWGILKGPP